MDREFPNSTSTSRYDQDSDVPLVLDTEQDRIIFIKTACLFFVPSLSSFKLDFCGKGQCWRCKRPGRR